MTNRIGAWLLRGSGGRMAALSVAFAMLLAIGVSATQTPTASAQAPAAPVTSQALSSLWWPYNWNNNSWNWWGNNAWNGWNWWNNYYNASYAWPYGLHASYSPYNYSNVFWAYTASSVNIVPGASSPAWIYCAYAAGGPVWVDATKGIPAGVFC